MNSHILSTLRKIDKQDLGPFIDSLLPFFSRLQTILYSVNGIDRKYFGKFEEILPLDSILDQGMSFDVRFFLGKKQF